MTHRPRFPARALAGIAGLVWLAMASPSAAQLGESDTLFDALQLNAAVDCAELREPLAQAGRGGQWLIGDGQGDGVALYHRAADPELRQRLQDPFIPVTCYGIFPEAIRLARGQDPQRVFVADADFQVCGWVDFAALLPERYDLLGPLAGTRRRDRFCRTPRAMPFGEFCQRAEGKLLAGDTATLCEGVPAGLRAKAVLTGEAGDAEARRRPEFDFYTTPDQRQVREPKTFFSVMEIHDVAFPPAVADGGAMVLVGDGEGDVFGWINLDALRLWPTRTGLFFDPRAQGVMFSKKGDMINHWRRGWPEPDVQSQGEAQVRDHIHGPYPLLSYPIVRTITPETDPNFRTGDPPFHEIIFLGSTTGNLAEDTLLSGTLRDLQRINIMVVIDTTESMRPYLAPIRDGIEAFIANYDASGLRIGSRSPETRLAVYAYSDFLDPTKTGLDDPIETVELVAPIRVGRGFELSQVVGQVARHTGLDDPIGRFDEAALETVFQLSKGFDEAPWFENGPRVVIHIADHGSRPAVDVADIQGRLERAQVFYLPIVVSTDDLGSDGRGAARQRFESQALALYAPLLAEAASRDDLPRIDFQAGPGITAETVKNQLDLVLLEVRQVLVGVREQVVGRTLNEAAARAIQGASARIVLDEALRQRYGLDEQVARAIAVADTGFTPLLIRQRGLEEPVNWVYTVALEESQVLFLEESFDTLCNLVGRPGQSGNFRRALVSLAETFSGDRIHSDREMRVILGDLNPLPSVQGGFLAQPIPILLQRSDSTDPQVVRDLRQDICWTSYHLKNAVSELYVAPEDLVWTGGFFQLKEGASASKRVYRYQPIVGPELVYLPAWFFKLPSTLPESAEPSCEFFC